MKHLYIVVRLLLQRYFTFRLHITFFSLYVFGEPEVHFRNFLLCCPSQRSAWPSAIAVGNPSGDWQSAVGWGVAGFEPGTAGQSLARYH